MTDPVIEHPVTSKHAPEGQPGARPVQPSAGAHQILKSMLVPDEQIVRMAAISPGIYWKTIFMLALSVLMLIFAFNLGLFLLLVTAIMFAIAALTKHFLLLGATNKRVIIRGGIINLDVIQMRYSKIESVELAWTIIGQILGYASVVITGTGNRTVVVPFVANAAQFRATMMEILMKKDDALDNLLD